MRIYVRLFGLICVALFLTNCNPRHPIKYLIPEGYVGWICIDYGIKGAPELRMAKGSYVVTFPAAGRVATSTKYEVGGALDDYYYYADGIERRLPQSSPGMGGMIWDGSVEDVSGEQGKHMYIFVGTEDQLKAFGWARTDKYGSPLVGPVGVAPN